MPTCAIVGCFNSKNLHSLPKQGAVRKEWLERINRKHYLATPDTRICETHFSEQAFLTEAENVDSSGRKRKLRKLRPKAIPTLNLRPVVASPLKKLADRKRRKAKKLNPISTGGGLKVPYGFLIAPRRFVGGGRDLKLHDFLIGS